MNSKDKIIIDLDNTITIENKKNYEDKDPNLDVIKAINSSKETNDILVFSSRNMRTFKGNLNKINSITKPIALKWLNQNNVNYSDLLLGKPWAGKNGWYVDDRNLSIEEFIFKFSGPFSDYSFDLIVPFFNEQENVKQSFENLLKLERLINVNSFILINNGSLDSTKKKLLEIKELNEKVKIIDLDKNFGYGHGLKAGLAEASSDYVLINHADNQFDPYNFIYSNMAQIKKMDAIMPIRLNRPLIDRLISFLLRFLLSIISLKKIKDFNGQPKILKLSKIKNISSLPNDYCIDFNLYRIFEKNSKYLPVMQLDRRHGSSSWKGDIFKSILILLNYISNAFSYKK
jgi:capsule biosynthesis phosphatase